MENSMKTTGQPEQSQAVGQSQTEQGQAEQDQTAEQGQTTAEYALIILGGATLATLFLAWVGETNRIGRLFDAILRSVDGLIP